MRIGIHHDGALGDAVLSLPCVRGIASDSAVVEWIGRGDVGTMLEALGVVQAAHDAGSSRFARWHAPLSDAGAQDLFDRYDQVFLFTSRPDTELARNIRAKVPDTQVIVTVPPDGDRTHVADFRLRQIPFEHRHTGQDGLAMPDGLTEQAREAVAKAGHRGQGLVITLHPGSGGRRKCWPLERYFALADQLASRSAAFILFLSGPAEAGATAAHIEGFVQGRAGMGSIAGSELPVVAALLARSGIFIGNDSGVTHLAAAVGAPVIALFGPTDPGLWSPQGKNARVIAAGAMEDIPVDAVLAAAEASIPRTEQF